MAILSVLVSIGFVIVAIDLNPRLAVALFALTIGILLTRTRRGPHVATIVVLSVAALSVAGAVSVQPVASQTHTQMLHKDR